ncbi:hypothetical protein BH10ACT1_BH10ACT1_42070 [soil metagenome]
MAEDVSTLRADARRNHERVVDAALVAFAEGGPDVALDEVARLAGVSQATLYRRFASRQELVAAVATRRFSDAVDPVITAALDGGDAWTGLVAVLDAVARQRTDGRWQEIFAAARESGLLAGSVSIRLYDALTTLLVRAQRAGVARADLGPDDLRSAMAMLRGLTVDDRPGTATWPRRFALLLDALRAAPAS